MTPRPYMYADQLAQVSPWSIDAIDRMCRDGKLRRGVHWFQRGARAKRIFKWDAIIQFLELAPDKSTTSPAAPRRRTRRGIDAEAATQSLQRLLD